MWCCHVHCVTFQYVMLSCSLCDISVCDVVLVLFIVWHFSMWCLVHCVTFQYVMLSWSCSLCDISVCDVMFIVWHFSMWCCLVHCVTFQYVMLSWSCSLCDISVCDVVLFFFICSICDIVALGNLVVITILSFPHWRLFTVCTPVVKRWV
jgi:hypothetical protein